MNEGKRGVVVQVNGLEAAGFFYPAEPLYDPGEKVLVIMLADGSSRVYNTDYVVYYHWLSEEDSAAQMAEYEEEEED